MLKKDAIIIIQDKLPEAYHFLPGSEYCMNIKTTGKDIIKNKHNFIILDSSNIDRIGEINLSLKVEKTGEGKAKLTTIDNNNNGKARVDYGTVSTKIVDGKKQIIVKGNEGTLYMTCLRSGMFNLKVDGMPASVDVIKK